MTAVINRQTLPHTQTHINTTTDQMLQQLHTHQLLHERLDPFSLV